MRKLLLVPAILVLAGTAANAADDATVDVRFQRPYKTGQNFLLSVTDTNRSVQQIQTPDGASNRQASTRRVTMEADVHVEKVDDHAQPAVVTAVIKKLASQTGDTADESPTELLKSGISITVTYTGNQAEISAMHDVELPDQARAALRDAFSLSTMSDDVFGAAAKKKGDTWPVNTKAMPYDRTNARAVDPADVTGTVTLKDIRPTAGIPCAQISATLTSGKIPGLSVEPKEATLTMVYTASVPMDADKPLIATSFKLTQHVVVEQKPLRAVTRTTVDSENTHESIWTPK